MPKKPRMLKCGPNKVKGQVAGSINAKDLPAGIQRASKEISAAYVKAEHDLTHVLCPGDCPNNSPRASTGTWRGVIKISAARGQRCRIAWSIRGEAKVNCTSKIKDSRLIRSPIRKPRALAKR